MQLFREREENIRISAENDNLKVQNFENQKKINMLMMINGTTDKKYYHFMTNDFQVMVSFNHKNFLVVH